MQTDNKPQSMLVFIEGGQGWRPVAIWEELTVNGESFYRAVPLLMEGEIYYRDETGKPIIRKERGGNWDDA